MDQKEKLPRGYVRGKDGKLKKKRLVIVDKPKPKARLLASTVRPPPPPPPRPVARLLASTVRPPPPPPPVQKKKKEKKRRKRLVIIPDPKPPPPPAPKPPPPPARPFVAAKKTSYDDLPDELRKEIFQFSGNPKSILEGKIISKNIGKENKIGIIDFELKRMFGKTLDNLRIKKKVPIYNASMVRKMKMIGMRVGGSNDKDIDVMLPEIQDAIGLTDYMRFLPHLDEKFDGFLERGRVRKEKQKASKKAEQDEKTAKARKDYDKFVAFFKDELKGVGKGGVRKIFNMHKRENYPSRQEQIIRTINRFKKTGSTEYEFVLDPGA